MPKVMITAGGIDEMGDPWSCKDGTPHTWDYRGKDKKEYRCSNCGIFISKAVLKEMTDNA